MKALNLILAVVLGVWGISASVYAESNVENEEVVGSGEVDELAPETSVPVPTLAATPSEVKLPKQGVLSVVGNGGYGSKSIPGWVDPDLQGDTLPAISGSLAKVANKEWQARVNNNSGDTFSVSLKIQQNGNNNSVLKSDSFSATLKPGDKVERTVRANERATGAALVLESWKKIEKR